MLSNKMLSSMQRLQWVRALPDKQPPNACHGDKKEGRTLVMQEISA